MCKQWLLITIALIPMIMFSGQWQSLDKQITPHPPTAPTEYNVKLQLFIDNEETQFLFYKDAKGTSYRFIDPLEGTKISIYPRTGKAPTSIIIERQEDGMYRINEDLFHLVIATGNKNFFQHVLLQLLKKQDLAHGTEYSDIFNTPVTIKSPNAPGSLTLYHKDHKFYSNTKRQFNLIGPHHLKEHVS